MERIEKGNKRIAITWNITKKCLFDCSICATRNRRHELSSSQKLAVFYSLRDIGSYHISELDFAGGDPLVDESSRRIILLAQDLLGKDTITVTTTWRGIEAVPKQELHLFLYSCELSVDITHSTSIRKELEYSAGNLRAIKQYSDYINHLTINTPIIDDDVTEMDIQVICQQLNKIIEVVNNVRIVVIRLMPVGNLDGSLIQLHRSPFLTINYLRKYLDPRIEIRLHCVLRGVVDSDSMHCGAASRKIGIDCEGNVFACAWAGDSSINDAPNTNPLYLGNLLEKPLDVILDSEKATTVRKMARYAKTSCMVLDKCTIRRG